MLDIEVAQVEELSVVVILRRHLPSRRVELSRYIPPVRFVWLSTWRDTIDPGRSQREKSALELTDHDHFNCYASYASDNKITGRTQASSVWDGNSIVHRIWNWN